MVVLILWLGAAYLIGSIPFGLILTRAGGYGDIRKVGSGNIGATNVLRTGNKALAATTLLLDFAKGMAAVIGVQIWGPALPDPLLLMMAAGTAATIGHIFPIWLGFKGGKGVATFLGAVTAALPFSALVFAAVWALTAFTTRRSSAGALAALISTLISASLIGGGIAIEPFSFLAGLVVLILYRHKDNIARLIAGTEPKIGHKTS